MGKDYNSLVGLFVAYLLVSVAIIEPAFFVSISNSFTQFFVGINQNLGIFFDLPTFMIVLGGSFGAVVTNFKLDDIKKLGPLTVQAALAPSEGDEAETINQIVELSQEARVNGLLSLEPKIKNIESELGNLFFICLAPSTSISSSTVNPFFIFSLTEDKGVP